MTDIAIKIEHLSKCYRIGGPRERYKTLRDTIVDAVKAPLQRLRGGHAYQDQTIWSLKDITFEVKRGEVIGIIGRNGAGKTTLLKILSRITEPTEGYAEIRGRVGSLLEVGTGFHPEMTGRENIYLNGAILGMKKKEIERKFDEIVAFAEVERFLDTPVKRYSSGMYVRLAFAVAAHLEPEILFVDEVLAVGDTAFQKKCLGKMGDVAKEGRTVLFVSHNMQSIGMLCQRGICLSSGRIQYSGSASDAVVWYLRSNIGDQILDREIGNEPRRPGEGTAFRITKISMSFAKNGSPQIWVPIEFVLDFECLARQCEVSPSVEVWRLDGVCAFTSDAEDDGMVLDLVQGATGTVRVMIPHPNLPPGRYVVRAVARSGGCRVIDWVDEALVFDIFPTDGISVRVDERHLGTRPRGLWKVERVTCP